MIGCGSIGSYHANGIKLLKDGELVALCDIHPEKIEELKEKCSVEANCYTDYKEMLEKEDLDVVVITTPDMMGLVGRIGKILGPKGLMPNPKSGTVTMDVTKALQEIKAGKVEYRLDKTNIIHTPIGKVSFGAEKLTDNFNALLEAVVKAKPAAAKGQYLRSVTVAATMGPGVKVNPAIIQF